MGKLGSLILNQKTSSGALTCELDESNRSTTPGGAANYITMNFDASQDEATYAYDKLQVSALQTLCCIKI